MDYSHAAAYFSGSQPYQFIGIPPLTPSHSNSAASEDFNTTSPPVSPSCIGRGHKGDRGGKDGSEEEEILAFFKRLPPWSSVADLQLLFTQES